MAEKSMAESEEELVCTCIHEETVRKVRGEMPSDTIVCDLSGFFKAVGDETRIRILFSLSRGGHGQRHATDEKLCGCDIAAVTGMTPSAISHQLRILKSAHLVKCEKQGKVAYYSLSDEHVVTVFNNALEHVCE